MTTAKCYQTNQTSTIEETKKNARKTRKCQHPASKGTTPAAYQATSVYCMNQETCPTKPYCRKLVPVGSIAVDKSLVAGIEVCLPTKLPIIKA